MTTYELEYRNKYSVEWRKPVMVNPFSTLDAAQTLRAERELTKAPDMEYRIIRVTREVVE